MSEKDTTSGRLEVYEGEKAQHVKAAEEIISKAQAEGRNLTESEKGEVKEHTTEAHRWNEKIKAERENRELMAHVAALGTSLEPVEKIDGKGAPRTIGEAFVASDSYKALLARGTTGKFSSVMELPEFGAVAGIVTEGTGANDDMILPQRIPGILPPVETPLGLTELFGTGTISQGNSVLLVREKIDAEASPPLPDNNADVVAEGNEKPASNIEFETDTATLSKIATVIKVSNEMLEDVEAMRSYLDGRLSTFVRQKREDTFVTQLLSQAGQTAAATDLTNGDNLFDAILSGAVKVQRAGGLAADGIAMSYLTWAELLTTKDDQGRYLSGGPFAGTDQRLWGRFRIAITERLGDDQIVVGAFAQGGTVWRKRGGVTVEATNSNEDDFLKNLVAIRAEERAVLFLQRPDAFAVVEVAS